jgi:hypothetical protein
MSFGRLCTKEKPGAKAKPMAFLARQDGLIPPVGQFAALLFYLSFQLVHKAHASAQVSVEKI